MPFTPSTMSIVSVLIDGILWWSVDDRNERRGTASFDFSDLAGASSPCWKVMILQGEWKIVGDLTQMSFLGS